MSRGKKNYKEYKILPQRDMHWALAVIYMLQSPDNVVYSSSPNRFDGTTLYRISDGIFQYHCKCWDRSRIFPNDYWAQVNVSGVSATRFTALAYHDRPDCKYGPPEDLCNAEALPEVVQDDATDDVIADRFERIEGTLAKICKKLKVAS